MWRIWIDTGGTFTDCVASAPDGRSVRFKVLSDSSLRGRVERVNGADSLLLNSPNELVDDFLVGRRLRLLGGEVEEAEIVASTTAGVVSLASQVKARAGDIWEVCFDQEVPVLAAHLVTATRPGTPLPEVSMRLATTRATNALLERSGARTLLLVTRGFADLLHIGNQQRPDLFALEVQRPAPLPAAVVEVDERIDARGEIVLEPDTEALVEAVGPLSGEFVAVAVALLHAYRNDAHERAVEQLLIAAGFSHVSRSSAVAPLVGAVARTATTVVNAYLSPAIDEYLEGVGEALGDGKLRVMTSAGGLQRGSEVLPKDCLLSGPAGGVVGAVRAAGACAIERLISFDMGGTSTDVARFDGDYDYRFSTELDGIRVLAPALAIETVAAGGGSICRFDGRRVRVGPESAGARPGPACYGAGGPLTLTDINLLLGRLDAARFEIPLVEAASRDRLEELLEELSMAEQGDAADSILDGLLQVANERMAEAIRRISVRRGYDPSEYALVAFGGAGGQHACAVADLLGMRRILVPRDASLLSAWGLGRAVIERIVERQILMSAKDFEEDVDETLAEMGSEATRRLVAEGVAPDQVRIRRSLLLLRLVGQDSTITIDHDPGRSISDAFADAYRERYGYRAPVRDLEVESARVIGSSVVPTVELEPAPEPTEAEPAGEHRCRFAGAWSSVPVYLREELVAGAWLEGPALVLERFGAVVVEPGWGCRVAEARSLICERGESG